MNAAGELCKKAGMQMAYHNHAHEFGGKPGMRPIDIFFNRLDPQLVKWSSMCFGSAWPGRKYAGWRVSGGRQRIAEFSGDSEDCSWRGPEALHCGAGSDAGRSAGEPAEELQLSEDGVTEAASLSIVLRFNKKIKVTQQSKEI